MGMTALIRNLNKLTKLGLLEDEGSLSLICERLTNPEAVVASKVHPFSFLLAMVQYSKGRGERGGLTWEPN